MVVCQGVTPSRHPSVVHACGSDVIGLFFSHSIPHCELNYTVVKQRRLSSLSSLAQYGVGRMCDATIY